MGRTILGPAERVEGFNAGDLSRFVAERYAPRNIIVAAAGGVDHDAIVRAAEAAFGHLEAHDGGAVEPAAFTGGERRVQKGLEQAHFAMAFETPGYREERVWTAQIFATAFGGGMSSRLFQEAREKRGLCYTIFSQIGAYSDSGLLTIYAGTSGEELGELAELTIDEIKRAAEDMSPAEVARARAQMKAGLVMGLESPSSRAERLARLTAIWDRDVPLEETVAHIDAVTADDVRAFAGQLIEARSPAVALYGPVAKAPSREALSARLAA